VGVGADVDPGVIVEMLRISHPVIARPTVLHSC
jgi:hypothetical protein